MNPITNEGDANIPSMPNVEPRPISVNPAGSFTSAAPAAPVIPATPAASVAPVAPVAPVVPSELTASATPAAQVPVTPQFSATSVAPVAPSAEAAPVAQAPVAPQFSAAPIAPVPPVAPLAEATPAAPVAPLAEATPVNLAASFTSVAPDAPITAVEPTTLATSPAPVIPDTSVNIVTSTTSLEDSTISVEPAMTINSTPSTPVVAPASATPSTSISTASAALNPAQVPAATQTPVPTSAPASASASVAPRTAAKAPAKKLKAKMSPKTKKTIIISSIATVTVVALGVAALLVFGSQGKMLNATKLVFDEGLIPFVNEAGDYDYVDRKGKVKLPLSLYRADYFKGRNASVKVYGNKIGQDNSSVVAAIINQKGEIVASGEDVDSSIRNQMWSVDGALYDGSGKTLRLINDPEMYSVEWSGTYNLIETKLNDGKESDVKSIIYSATGKKLFESTEDKKYAIGSNKFYNKYWNITKHKYCAVEVNENDVTNGIVVDCETGNVVYEVKHDIYNIRVSDNVVSYTYRDGGNISYGYAYLENGEVKYQLEAGSIRYVNLIAKNYLSIEDNDDMIFYYDLKQKKELTEDEFKALGSKVYKGLAYDVDASMMNDCSDDKVSISTVLNNNATACEWDGFDFFDSYTSNYLLAKNKRFVIGEKDDKEYLVDLSKKKTKIEEPERGIIYYSSDSPFVIMSNYNNYEAINLATGKRKIFSRDQCSARQDELYRSHMVMWCDGYNIYFDKNLEQFFVE